MPCGCPRSQRFPADGRDSITSAGAGKQRRDHAAAAEGAKAGARRREGGGTREVSEPPADGRRWVRVAEWLSLSLRASMKLVHNCASAWRSSKTRSRRCKRRPTRSGPCSERGALPEPARFGIGLADAVRRQPGLSGLIMRLFCARRVQPSSGTSGRWNRKESSRARGNGEAPDGSHVRQAHDYLRGAAR